MKSRRHLTVQPRRDAWVEVNLGAIEKNALAIRKLIPTPVALMAIVKADAYGHGAAMVLPTLSASGVSIAGVASVDEAIQLRQSGVKMPLLVIGVVPDWAVQYATDYDIALTIFEAHHVESLRKAYQQDQKPFRVHIKVDTGMHRIGVDWEHAAAFVALCRETPFIEVEGIFSHLVDSHDERLNALQLERWASVCAQIPQLPRFVHISNSGHALSPEAFNAKQPVFNNLARLGIAFFGYGNHPLQKEIQLLPVMSVKARIVHLQAVPPQTGISYSHTYSTDNRPITKVATVPMGYADGIPRRLSNRIEGLLNGVRVPQIGTITMDQMMFDVSEVSDAALGDTITLIGQEPASLKHPTQPAIWLDTWATQAETIEYELMCALRVRLPKTYTR